MNLTTQWDPTPYLEHFKTPQAISHALGINIKAMHQQILKRHINTQALHHLNNLMLKSGINVTEWVPYDAKKFDIVIVERMIMRRAKKEAICARFNQSIHNLNKFLTETYKDTKTQNIRAIIRRNSKPKVNIDDIKTNLLIAIKTCSSVSEIAKYFRINDEAMRWRLQKHFGTSNLNDVKEMLA